VGFVAGPYSTGAGGIHLEARVAAYFICEAPVRGLAGEFATAVLTQRAAFGDPLDDVIVTGVFGDCRETRLGVQIKNKLSFTENDDEWVDALKRSWDRFSDQKFDSALHRIGVGIGTYNALPIGAHLGVLQCRWQAFPRTHS
jgi:hypothetical protein